jgi:hypothetical protein
MDSPVLETIERVQPLQAQGGDVVLGVVDDGDHDRDADRVLFESPSLATDAPGAACFMIIDLGSKEEGTRVTIDERKRTMAFRITGCCSGLRGLSE